VDAFEAELAARDPSLRAARGVYFTPAPLVGWLVRSVDALLRRHLGEARGLASRRVHVLDPAAGTGAFLLGAAAHGCARGRLHGREILRGACAAARASLGREADVRAGDALSAELDPRRACAVPDGARLVVLGNPPWRGDAPARGAAIERLMGDYKRTVRVEERQIQRLSNDYVRFFRLAQELVERRGEGIVAFVSDAGYLDGVLFRDVRAELLRVSAAAWVLDLGGGMRRGARAADDGNVFGVTQPVAVGMFVVKRGASAGASAGAGALRYARLTGTRAEKLAALDAGDVTTIRWERVAPAPPLSLFRPARAGAPHDAYARWVPLLEAAGTGDPATDRDDRYGTGVKTRHDSFVVAFDPEEAVAKVRRLAARREPDDVLVRELGLCTTAHFDVRAARARAAADPAELAAHVRPIAYRPFDTRYVVYLRDFVCEPKARTMRHLLEAPDNVALAVLRRDRRETASGYFAGAGLVAKDYVSNADDALVWPMIVVKADGTCEPNLSARWLEAFDGDARAAFAWTYAVLFSPWYRATFAGALAVDFPRLPRPRPRAREALAALVAIGARLLDLHARGAEPLADARGWADGERDARSASRYPAASVSERLSSFRVGAYLPADAWLAARRGRTLGDAEREHHARIVAACAETQALARSVDAAIDASGGYRAVFR
jgi:hypothetical protein